ncbi:MAG: DUF6951 family protein [Methanosarcina sp.]
MVKISVSSPVCESNHTITGKVEGEMIIITIDTPCEKFRETPYLEFPLHAIPENERLLIRNMEKQTDCSLECTKECALDCTRGCLIPPAILNVYSIEKELAQKELTVDLLEKLVELPFLETSEYTVSEYQ